MKLTSGSPGAARLRARRRLHAAARSLSMCSAYANGGRIGNDETGSLANVNGNDMSPMQRRWDAGSDPASIGVAPSRPSQRLARRGSGCEYPSSTMVVAEHRRVPTETGSTERWLVRRPDRSSGRNPGQHPRRQPASAGVVSVTSNKRMKLTSHRRHNDRCVRLAAYPRCSADTNHATEAPAETAS